MQDADTTTRLIPKSKKDSIFVRHKKKCRCGAGLGMDFLIYGHMYLLSKWQNQAAHLRPIFKSRDWSPKFETGLNIIIGVVQKV